MRQTLVVIDMQAGFPTTPEFKFKGSLGDVTYDERRHDPELTKAIRRLVAANIREGNPIVLVEYADEGRTIPPIYNMLKGYKHRARCSKENDGGSDEVIRTIKRRKFPIGKLIVCGVFADCCVSATVGGLSRKLPKSKIIVPKNAIMSCGMGIGVGTRNYEKRHNVKIRKPARM